MGNNLDTLYGNSTSDRAWYSFENAWRSGQVPDSWDAIASSSPDRRGEIAAEFAMMDLEWRWRLNMNDQLRDVMHYIELLAPLGLTEENRRAMLEHAFVVRSKWGDRPTIDEILVDWPDRMELKPILRQSLSDNFPVIVSLCGEDTLKIDASLSVTAQLGHQRTGEPEPCAVVIGEEICRFIIAPKDDASIAAVALEITRDAVDTVRVESFGKTIGVAADSAASALCFTPESRSSDVEMVCCGKSLKLPVSLNFDRFNVQITPIQ